MCRREGRLKVDESLSNSQRLIRCHLELFPFETTRLQRWMIACWAPGNNAKIYESDRDESMTFKEENRSLSPENPENRCEFVNAWKRKRERKMNWNQISVRVRWVRLNCLDIQYVAGFSLKKVKVARSIGPSFVDRRQLILSEIVLNSNEKHYLNETMVRNLDVNDKKCITKKWGESGCLYVMWTINMHIIVMTVK